MFELISRHFVLRAAPVAVAALLAAAPTAATPLPWVGLSAYRAVLLGEQGLGHDGPGAVDHFGFAVAAGDFNHDGVDDLAISVPYNDCNFEVWDCGTVQVRLGRSRLGLAPETTVLRQGPLDTAEANEAYGYALAAGDMDGDGYDDLAIGVPWNLKHYESGPYPIGQVDLHFGTNLGPALVGLPYRPGNLGVPGLGYSGSKFGAAIAFGDFDGDGRDDLAIGAPSDGAPGAGGNTYAGGTVTVVARDGEGNVGGFEIFQGDQGLSDLTETGERFGAALSSGDFNHDGYDDLAIGVPQEDDTGAVMVVYGSPWSLIYPGHWYIGQWDLGEPAEQGDHFGEALAAGDFNGDGYDDLAIGAPEEDGGDGTPVNMGLVAIVYGSSAGLSTGHTPGRLYEHMLYGSGSEDNDYFGSSLAAGDFDGDGIDDLAIGTEGEDNNWTDSGAVSIVRGTPQGLPGEARVARPAPAAEWMIPDQEGGSPLYGFAVAAGDFDGSGTADLAIGGPNDDIPELGIDTGTVAVLYGALFADGFESHSTGAWSWVAP